MEETQTGALVPVTKALEKKISGFKWEVTTDPDHFCGALGCYKINTVPQPTEWDRQLDEAADLCWPPPSMFLKKKRDKEAVWEDIEKYVVPALKKNVISIAELKLSDHQLQQLMQRITNSDLSFEVDHPDGLTIGVNKTTGVDLSITTADISSMLAATWLFGAKAIRLYGPDGQGKAGVK